MHSEKVERVVGGYDRDIPELLDFSTRHGLRHQAYNNRFGV